MPASTANASIVRMMNRDGTRMKLRPGSQYTYRHNSKGQSMNISVATIRQQQVKGRPVVAHVDPPKRSARRWPPEADDRNGRQQQDEHPWKQEGVRLRCEWAPERRLQVVVDTRRRSEKTLDARLHPGQILAPQSRFDLRDAVGQHDPHRRGEQVGAGHANIAQALTDRQRLAEGEMPGRASRRSTRTNTRRRGRSTAPAARSSRSPAADRGGVPRSK